MGSRRSVEIFLVRHGEREELHPVPGGGLGANLTDGGVAASEQLGRELIADVVATAEPDSIIITGSVVKRTQETVGALVRGAGLEGDSRVEEVFPDGPDEWINCLLRRRPDGLDFDLGILAAAADQVLEKGSVMETRLVGACEKGGVDVQVLLDELSLLLKKDTVRVARVLDQYFSSSADVSEDLLRDLLTAHFDGFLLTGDEIDMYAAHIVSYLGLLVGGYLSLAVEGGSMMVLAGTHDYNLAAMAMKILGKVDDDGQVVPLDSIGEIGGAPDFLACLHLSLVADGGELGIRAEYNGAERPLLPGVVDRLRGRLRRTGE